MPPAGEHFPGPRAGGRRGAERGPKRKTTMITKADAAMIRSLGDKRARTELGLFVAEGEKLVSELPGSGFRVRRLLVREDSAVAGGFGVEAERVTAREMERISHLKTPQGVLALVEIPRRRLPDAPGRELTLALDGVQDPGNLGTILRLADWFGIRDVLCSPQTADCFNPKVVQATMGAILRVRVHYCDLPRVLSGAGVPVYGTFLDGENIYGAGLGPSGIVAMGNEGNGITPGVAAAVTRRLYIPPYPPGHPSSESLNVAVATAIVCSEFRRRM